MLSLFRSRVRDESLSGDPFDDRYFQTDPSTGYTYLKPNSGIYVNERTAMTYSACWAATMLLCSAISMIPLKLFRKLPGGGSEPAMDDPRYSLVHDTPNADMTSMMFRSSRTAQQVNWGNAYAEIQRDRGGRPIALLPIHASRIPPDSNITRGSDGRLKYKINSDNGRPPRELSLENVLHIPSPMSDDGIVGKGVVEAARRSIGLGISAETHGGAYFGNGARPGIIIKGAKFKKKEDADEFRRQWSEIHGGGPHNSGKPAILPSDADVTALQFNAQDSQFLETRQFSIDDIARWYGVPPHTIGSLMRATNNNIEQLALELTKYALMRWTVPQEQEMNRKLLTKEEQKTLFFLHVFEGLERADLATRTAALKEQFFNGEITLNEWRALENRSPIGPMGDIHFVQAAMVPLQTAVNGPPKPAESSEQGPSKADETRQSMETYGIAVRAGSVTPQIDDEVQYRLALGLPPMSEEAKEQWKTDKTRRPVTLKDAGDRAGVPGGPPIQPSGDDGQPAAEDEPQATNDLAAQLLINEQLQAEVARTKRTQQQLAGAMLRDVMGRMLSVEIHNVKHIAEKPNRFDARLREFYGKHKLTMERSLLEPVAAVLSANGREPTEHSAVGVLAHLHVTESLKQLDALCDCKADELASKVDECVSTWHEERTAVTV